MKKLSIVLLAVFFIGIANVNAQTEIQTEGKVIYENGDQKIIPTEDTKKCTKSGKVCDETCKNKAKGTCCKGKKKTSCSKSKEVSLNFNKTNNYLGEKSSCSKKAKKGCCKKEAKKCGENCTKPCCAPAAIEEAALENE